VGNGNILFVRRAKVFEIAPTEKESPQLQQSFCVAAKRGLGM